MEKENKHFGNLFNKIDLVNEYHLDAILDTMNKEHSIIYLIEAVKCAYERNAFTIGEIEVISKAIRVLVREEDKV